MKSMMIGMLAETQVHIGAGQSSGFVDLPVAREGITSYPVIPSTGLKGSFKESFGDDAELFGSQDKAGAVIFGEGRLLLLPVRSLTSSYRWVTCPHILERLKRDCKRTLGKDEIASTPSVQEGDALGSKADQIFLEEREFNVKGGIDDNLIDLVKRLIPNKDVQERVASQLVILNDSDFKWFAQYGLAVNARNVLKKETKASDNLWYEETLPADSVFYSIVMERANENLEKVKGHIEKKPYIQLGGNETVGQGWFNISLIEG